MRRSTLYSLAALVFMGACATDLSGPAAPLNRAATFRMIAAGGGGISNAKKYHDTGMHPATGRSGSATLEARALLDKDGNTFVEATTGSLEAGTHSGTIAKSQLKYGAVTRNFNGLSNTGYWSTTVAGLAAHQGVQVQANVRGIDPRRTDVVTVSTTIGKRPDIAVPSVSAPHSAPPNTPVTISGVVQELNGDVGARADCVLSVDGTNVDQASGIWIDAAGTVSCMFSYAFVTTGSHTVSVTATNVIPGDWDTANNSASASIDITSPGGSITSGYLQVQDYHFSYDYFNRYSNSSGESSDNTTTYSYDFSNAWGNASEARTNAQPTQRMDMTLGTNGTSVVTTSAIPYYSYSYDDGYSIKYGCTYLQSPDGAASGQACSYDYYGAGESSYYYFSANVGTITYYGSNTYCDVFGCNTYTWNTPQVYAQPASMGWSQGSTANINVAFLDADGVNHTVDEALSVTDRYQLGPWNDYSYCYSDGYYSSCYGSVNYRGFYDAGWASFYHP